MRFATSVREGASDRGSEPLFTFLPRGATFGRNPHRFGRARKTLGRVRQAMWFGHTRPQGPSEGMHGRRLTSAPANAVDVFAKTAGQRVSKHSLRLSPAANSAGTTGHTLRAPTGHGSRATHGSCFPGPLPLPARRLPIPTRASPVLRGDVFGAAKLEGRRLSWGSVVGVIQHPPLCALPFCSVAGFKQLAQVARSPFGKARCPGGA